MECESRPSCYLDSGSYRDGVRDVVVYLDGLRGVAEVLPYWPGRGSRAVTHYDLKLGQIRVKHGTEYATLAHYALFRKE